MIGVVGPGRAGRIATAIERAGATTVVGEASAVLGANPELVVAVGDGALVDLLRAGVDAPVAPIETGPNVPDVETAVDRAEALVAGEYDTRRWSTVEIRRSGERVARAAFDAMLVTSDPGSISEYTVRAGDLFETVRADGIVVATPAGSRGYANAAGGPTMTGDSDAASIVPIGTFRMDRPRWTYDLDAPAEVAVARDEEPVALVVDGRDSGAVETGIEVAAGRPIEAVVPGE